MHARLMAKTSPALRVVPYLPGKSPQKPRLFGEESSDDSDDECQAKKPPAKGVGPSNVPVIPANTSTIGLGQAVPAGGNTVDEETPNSESATVNTFWRNFFLRYGFLTPFACFFSSYIILFLSQASENSSQVAPNLCVPSGKKRAKKIKHKSVVKPKTSTNKPQKKRRLNKKSKPGATSVIIAPTRTDDSATPPMTAELPEPSPVRLHSMCNYKFIF